jgi:hypothetical protein
MCDGVLSALANTSVRFTEREESWFATQLIRFSRAGTIRNLRRKSRVPRVCGVLDHLHIAPSRTRKAACNAKRCGERLSESRSTTRQGNRLVWIFARNHRWAEIKQKENLARWAEGQAADAVR